MGWRDGLRGVGNRINVYVNKYLPGALNYLHQLTEERPDCSVDPHCSKDVGQSDVEGVLCAGLQSHDVEETPIPHNLVGQIEGAVNKDSDICEASS